MSICPQLSSFAIAERLTREGQDVVVVEQDPVIRARVQDQLDVLTVEGRGSSPRVLEEAGVRGADMLIAVADIDEVNVAVMRDGKLILPHGATVLREEDHIYSHFSLTAKWICSFCVLVGWLEVYSVVVLFFPEFWRK